MAFKSIYTKGALFLILLFPILLIKQCDKRAKHFFKDLEFFPCDEEYIGIPGANFSSNCVDGFSKVPDFTLINHNGDTVSNISLEGKNYILHFFFASCPKVCPTNTVHIFQNIYGEDTHGNKHFKEDEITILSISIDNDSPEVLQSYMNRFKIDLSSNWHFLTGDRNYIQQFANDMSQLVENNFKDEDKEHMGYSHSEFVLLVDTAGFFRKNIDGIIWDAQTTKGMRTLKEDIKQLKFNQNKPRKNEY